MAKTRPNITVPPGTWLDLNAALNAQIGEPAVNLGTPLNIKLESSATVRICEKATAPLPSDGYRTLTSRDFPVQVTNSVGVWVYSIANNSVISVEAGS